ncbi:MAG: GH92 family glycosyl hydrolase [Bacteroidota bacterium]|nr:GH92 family glycosyl hydrolase [Bacteroidota bacterium]
MSKKIFILFLIACIPFSGFTQQSPVDLVYPYLDSAHSRWFFFSSACQPFGMVSLFPDNNLSEDWNSGYRYATDTIKDFSHIHEWQLSGVAVMPVSFSKSDVPYLLKDYSSSFLHKEEIVMPGYHSVILSRYKIKAELTATNRVGVHRYTFPAGKNAGIVFQLGGHLGPSEIPHAEFRQTGRYEIRGYMVNAPTIRRPKNATVYFSAVFNCPIKTTYLSGEGKITTGLKQWGGKNGKLLVELDNKNHKPVLMKVGLSFTSEEEAALNLKAEMPDWNFEKVKSAAIEKWNNMLGWIQIEGGTLEQQRRFYTDLWHAIMGRRIISDYDGKYCDCTGTKNVIRQLPLDKKGKPKFNMYNSDAFWGAQWTLNTLWQLVYPEIAEEFCNSFIEYYKNGGIIPRGPSGGNYTYVMTGASSTPFFVGAWQKGIRGFDINLAYEGLRKNHLPGGLMSKVGYEHKTSKGGGVEFYIKNGYVPYPLSDTTYGMHQDGATITLENAYQDWCLAQLAKSLNKDSDYNYFMKRSENFKNIYNTSLRFMVPKDKNGNWFLPFDPLVPNKGFEEANSAQYTWFVPHNLPALFSLMGGNDSAINRLNHQFELTRPYRFCNEHPENLDQPVLKFPGQKTNSTLSKFVNEQRTWVNYSNQPSTEMAFIFNYAGAPWLTQYWSRMVVDSAYSKLSPFYGYNGDEDQGQMGALSVLMKLGLFQMTGGCEENPRYELGSPIFDKITIMLNPKYFRTDKLIIETRHNNIFSPYIQSVTLNNKVLKTFYFNQSDINSGAHLIIEMGNRPNKSWGK